MKTTLSILALTLLAIFQAQAQVDVQVVLNQTEFLPSESVQVSVRIINRSGQTLHLGDDSDWLTFDVESKDGMIVDNTSEVPVRGAFDLESSQTATKKVNIQPYFSIRKQGHYTVTATLNIKAWNVKTKSAPVEFSVINGAKFWSQEFGVPLPAGVTNQLPEIRKYTLEEANYLRKQLRMYVMVTDQSESKVFKVSAIGPMVSFSQPEEQIDRSSNLHVIYQSGPQSFTYTVVNPDGEIISQDMYDYFDTRPRLSVNSDGNIMVAGGVRRPRPGELPDVKMPDQLPAPLKK